MPDLDDDYALPTSPARNLAIGEAATAALLARTDDATTVEQGMVEYAGEAMWPALRALALQLRHGKSIVTESGWLFERMFEAQTSRWTDIRISSATGRPGSLHLAIEHNCALNEAGKAERRRLYREIPADAPFGLRLVKQINIDASLNKHLDFWEQPQEGDLISNINMTALRQKAGAAPLGLSDGDACLEQTYDPAACHTSVWWPGIVLNIVPQNHLAQDDPFSFTANGRRGAHIANVAALRILAGGVKAAGLSDMAREHEREISLEGWKQFGDPKNRASLELGMAIAHASRGLLDYDAQRHLRDFDALLSAGDMTAFWPSLRKLVEGLIEHGFTSPDDRYECNDLRDHMYARPAENGWAAHLRTENGSFTFTASDLDRDASLMLHVRKGERKILLGGYRMTDGVFVAMPGSTALVEHTNLDWRLRNTAQFLAQSVACCFDLDHRPDATGPSF